MNTAVADELCQDSNGDESVVCYLEVVPWILTHSSHEHIEKDLLHHSITPNDISPPSPLPSVKVFLNLYRAQREWGVSSDFVLELKSIIIRLC